MQIIIKNKALDEWLENVAVAWRAQFPERATMYRELLQQRLGSLAGPSGMSKEGHLRYAAEIPQEIFWVIDRKIPGFFQSPANVRKFQQYFMGDLVARIQKNKFFIEQKKEKE